MKHREINAKLKRNEKDDVRTYSLYARDISHAWYTIFLSSGKNWFKKLTQWVYSSKSFDSLGCGSRFFIRFRIMIGAP